MAKGNKITLKAADGFALGGFKSAPAGKAKGGVVILQEIFGVNSHIQHVCDEFAAEGYVAVAPALFDRAEKDADIGYTEIGRAREIVGKLTDAEIQASVESGGPFLCSVHAAEEIRLEDEA